MPLITSYTVDQARQYRGNLHAHTTESDGPYPPQGIVQAYADMGYDFLMLSDHDMVTDTSALDPRGMTLIPGNEITAEGVHLLHVRADGPLMPTADRQPILDAIAAQGGLSIMNHPNWGENFNHCDQKELETLTGYVGVEIYNGVSERAEGLALATDRWDRLLSRGRRIWGFGNDDCHDPCDFGIAWNMVFAEDASVDALVAAMRSGNFYVSTGVRIDAIQVDRARLEVYSRDAQCFRVVRDHGMIVAEVEGPELRYELPDVAPLSYVRVECYGAGTRMAWTQPFWIE